MTKETVYNIVKGKSFYKGMAALSVRGLTVHAVDENSRVKLIVAGNNKVIWKIYYCHGLHNKHAWIVDEPLETR